MDEITNMDVSLNQKLDGNVMTTMAGTGIVTKGCNIEGLDGLGVGGRRLPSSSWLASLSSPSLSSMLLSSAPTKWETASSLGAQRRRAMKEELVKKEIDRKEMERLEMERKEFDRKEMERMDRKEIERMEMERKESERKETEREEMERKETERKELERKDMEWKKKLERKETNREKAFSYRAKWRKAMKKEMERKELDRKVMERKEMETKEMERMEAEKKEKERMEAEKKEMERKKTEMKGMERKEFSLISRKNVLPSSVTGRVHDMFAALEIGRKEEKIRGSNEGRKNEGCNGEGRMKRMGEGKEKEIGKEILEELDRVGKKKEGEGSSVGFKRRKDSKKKGTGREETLEVLRRRNSELMAQLREVMEENALLHERIRKKTPGKPSSPRMRKIVKETMMDVDHGDVDGPVDLPREEEFPPLPPLPPPWGGGMQDGSKKKVGPCIVNDAQVISPVKEACIVECRTEVAETSAVSELKAADWRVVARRSWRRSRVEDVLSPPPPLGSLRKRELLVVGLEESAAPCKIMEALSGIGSCPKEDIRMGPIRTRSNGFGTAWVQLPAAAALKVAKEGCVRVGWTTARVELLQVRPLQCFKCWSFGHAQYACRSMANRWRACYRCGQKGHMARDCDNPVHCVVCYDAGMDTQHRLGGPLCAALKREGNMVEGSE